MESYVTIKEFCEYRFEDRKSVFIGFAKPINCETDALEFISSVKKSYPDAKHWVYAYILRDNSVMRYTDDREPQGTAGMPVLDTMRKNGITNAVIVVVRYFGGVLLGTGGLVHAYTEAALGALRGAKIVKYDMYAVLSLEVSYSDHQKILSILYEYDFDTKNTEYTEVVKITGSIIEVLCEKLIEKTIEATSGRIKTEIVDKKYDFRE